MDSKAVLKALGSNPVVSEVLSQTKGESFPRSPRLFGDDDIMIMEECYRCLEKVGFKVNDPNLKIPQNAIAPLTKANQRPNSFLAFLTELILSSESKTAFCKIDDEGNAIGDSARQVVAKVFVDCLTINQQVMRQIMHRYIYLLALAARIVNEAVAKPPSSEETKPRAKGDRKGKRKESPITAHEDPDDI